MATQQRGDAGSDAESGCATGRQAILQSGWVEGVNPQPLWIWLTLLKVVNMRLRFSDRGFCRLCVASVRVGTTKQTIADSPGIPVPPMRRAIPSGDPISVVFNFYRLHLAHTSKSLTSRPSSLAISNSCKASGTPLPFSQLMTENRET